MKHSWKIYLLGIPFAIGFILSLLSITYVTDSIENGESALAALVLGVIGIPILLVTSASIFKNE